MYPSSINNSIMKKITILFAAILFSTTTFSQTFNGATGPITDNNCGAVNQFPVTVSGIGVITFPRFEIRLDITHPNDDNLDIYLIAPNGTQVTLLNDLGGSGDNYTNTIFYNAAENSIYSGAPPYTGNFRPQGVMTSFNDINADGIWILKVCDDTSGNVGTLNSWSLNFMDFSIPPANDSCSGAISLTVNPDNSCSFISAGNLQGATASLVEGLSCSGSEDDDVWFSFVATATIHQISLLNISGSTLNVNHSLWTGSDCNNLSLVPDSCSDINSSTPTGLVVGQTYYLRVYTNTPNPFQTTTFNVCVGIVVTPPINDDCSGAISLTVGNVFNDFALDGSNLGASDYAPITINCEGPSIQVNSGVFYAVTVPASGAVTIEARAAYTTEIYMDITMLVLAGSCSSLIGLACNDVYGNNELLNKISMFGQTPGSTLYVKLFKKGTSPPSSNSNMFKISAYTAVLGVDDFDADNFYYYPNPVEQFLNLSYNQEISNVEVFNLLGQKMISKTIHATETNVDFASLPKGIYLVNISAGNQMKTIKVVKE